MFIVVTFSRVFLCVSIITLQRTCNCDQHQPKPCSTSTVMPTIAQRSQFKPKTVIAWVKMMNQMCSRNIWAALKHSQTGFYDVLPFTSHHPGNTLLCLICCLLRGFVFHPDLFVCTGMWDGDQFEHPMQKVICA